LVHLDVWMAASRYKKVLCQRSPRITRDETRTPFESTLSFPSKCS
jgi:hypothetical protein